MALEYITNSKYASRLRNIRAIRQHNRSFSVNVEAACDGPFITLCKIYLAQYFIPTLFDWYPSFI